MTDKLVRARSDPGDSDLNLPTIHLDAAAPVADSRETTEFGFSFADEWKGGKRNLDDKHSDRHYDATHKRDSFPPSDDAQAGGSGGLMFADGPPRKRDLFNPLDPEGLLDPVDTISLETLPKTSQSDPVPKGWSFKDAPHRKRQDSVTDVVDDVDPEFPRPRHGWLWHDAPHRRDEAPDPCIDTNEPSLIFKDAPINCSRGIWARMKRAVRSILP